MINSKGKGLSGTITALFVGSIAFSGMMFSEMSKADEASVNFAGMAPNCVTSKELSLPQWRIGEWASYDVVVSNVSATDVDVEVKVYDAEGVRIDASYSKPTEYRQVQFSSSPVTAPATLASGKTGSATVTILHSPLSSTYGRATISWSSSSCLTEAIQVHALGNYMVNGGQPF